MTRHLTDERSLMWERTQRYKTEVQLIRDTFHLSLVDWFALDDATQLELIRMAQAELTSKETGK